MKPLVRYTIRGVTSDREKVYLPGDTLMTDFVQALRDELIYKTDKRQYRVYCRFVRR